MRLEPLLIFRNSITDVQEIGDGPFGIRRTYIVGAGTFEGERLRGEILPGGGDWMTIGKDGLANLDVRKTLRTHEGALIRRSYQGLYRCDEALAAKIERGEDAEFGETLFQVLARFETGDERYDWLNSTLAVGEGRETSSGVEYRLFSLDRA